MPLDARTFDEISCLPAMKSWFLQGLALFLSDWSKLSSELFFFLLLLDSCAVCSAINLNFPLLLHRFALTHLSVSLNQLVTVNFSVPCIIVSAHRKEKYRAIVPCCSRFHSVSPLLYTRMGILPLPAYLHFLPDVKLL